jgi:hypothetical protein
VIGQVVDASSWVDVALAMLNVVQTIALAYLAADRHSIRAARSQGYATRATDGAQHPKRNG